MSLNHPSEPVKVYLCGIDWGYEVGHAADGNTIYPDVESLKKYAKCHTECGIVEAEIRFVRVVQQGRLIKGYLPEESP